MKVDGREFKSQKALKSETSRILHEIGRCCTSIRSAHPGHYAFLIDLIKRHPDASKSDGVLDMYTAGIEAWRFPTVMLLKATGSDDVSLLKTCVTGRHSTNHATTVIEFRELIRPQICAYRATAVQVCVFCGATADLHVDHVYPFSRLVAEHTPPFIEYHAQHARFQMLCAGCNLKKSNQFTGTAAGRTCRAAR